MRPYGGGQVTLRSEDTCTSIAGHFCQIIRRDLFVIFMRVILILIVFLFQGRTCPSLCTGHNLGLIHDLVHTCYHTRAS